MLRQISEQRIVPVLRCGDVDDAVATARSCARAGLRVVELTRSTPNVEQAIERLTAEDRLTIGLGTITSQHEVGPAVSSGASFVISFFAPPSMVQKAHALDIAAIPGAFTPSEVAACVETGADAVKLFPASRLSPSYLKDLRAVLPAVRFMATGGLAPVQASLGQWLSAGAWAIGLSGALGTAATVGEAEVGRRARQALAVRRRANGSAVSGSDCESTDGSVT